MTIHNPFSSQSYRTTIIRLIKQEGGMKGMPEISVDADFPCEVVQEDQVTYETETEWIIGIRHLLLTDACLATMRLSFPFAPQVGHVLVEGKELPFSIHDGIVSFLVEISALIGNSRTLYTHTLIREPGITLRIEQNRIERRAGRYREGTYPSLQIEAAHGYQFAMREIMHMTGLPRMLHEQHLGYILILGFETCNEIHGDWPPHWHFIYRWPTFCGSQAPHIYLGEKGEMTYNRVSIDGIHGISTMMETGKWFTFVTPYGKEVMAISIQSDGSLSFARPQDAVYTIGAFDVETRGVSVFRDGELLGTVTTEDLPGRFVCHWKSRTLASCSYEDVIRYDEMTGMFQDEERTFC